VPALPAGRGVPELPSGKGVPTLAAGTGVAVGAVDAGVSAAGAALGVAEVLVPVELEADGDDPVEVDAWPPAEPVAGAGGASTHRSSSGPPAL
jgi:hypothetical protein